ncbi:MAG TPA: hypothetical protein PLM20_08830 [Syntrophomonadaceae bacterium]|nr:hypothetical protein [Syntrophomonadaceae bacterium]
MNGDIIFGIGGMGFVLFILTLLTIIIVVVVSQLFKTSRAKAASKAQITRDEAYRKLADEAISFQKQMTENHQQLTQDISEMKDRINAIEKMLREIE